MGTNSFSSQATHSPNYSLHRTLLKLASIQSNYHPSVIIRTVIKVMFSELYNFSLMKLNINRCNHVKDVVISFLNENKMKKMFCKSKHQLFFLYKNMDLTKLGMSISISFFINLRMTRLCFRVKIQVWNQADGIW